MESIPFLELSLSLIILQIDMHMTTILCLDVLA